MDMNTGRKLPRELENPIDNVMIDIAGYLAPYFNALGFMPNGLTTLSFLFGLLAVYYLKRGKVLYFSLSFLVSYFFDCFDGYFARLYGLQSQFGDVYDHFTDTFVGISFVAVAWQRYAHNKNINVTMIISVFVLLNLLMSLHLGCQQVYINKGLSNGEGESLDVFTHMCGSMDNEKTIAKTRYVGVGTFVVACIGLVWYMERAQS